MTPWINRFAMRKAAEYVAALCDASRTESHVVHVHAGARAGDERALHRTSAAGTGACVTWTRRPCRKKETPWNWA